MKRKRIQLITGVACACIAICLIAGFLYAGREVPATDGVYAPASSGAVLSSRITPSVALNRGGKVCCLPNPDSMSESMEIAFETERNLKYGRVLKLDSEKLGGKKLRFAVLEGNRLKSLDTCAFSGWTIYEGDVFACGEQNLLTV